MENAGTALNVVNSACVQRRLGLEVVSQWVERQNVWFLADLLDSLED